MRSLLPALLVPVLCAAQEPAASPVAKPALTFAKTHHDFGRIPDDKKVAVRFKATNTGDAPLQIKQVVPSCGCTYTVLGQWYLKPGESTELEATFSPLGMRGLIRKSMQVVSDDPVKPVQTLTFEAEVYRDIVESTRAVFFSEVPRTATRKATVRLESGSGQTVQVTELTAANAPYLTLTSHPEGKAVVVEIALDGRKVPANRNAWTDTVSIRTTSTSTPVIPITVQWEMRTPVSATPRAVAWAEPAGRELRATVTLRHGDQKPFRILAARPTSTLIRVEGVGRPAAVAQEVVVILSNAARAGMVNEKVVFSLDDPEQPQVELRVSAALR